MIKKTKQKKSHAPRHHFLVEVFGRRWGRQLINLCQWGLALVFFLLGLALFAALLGYDPTDPSFTTLSSGPIKNPMGVFGAAVSDIGFSFLGGLASYALPLLCLLWGWSLADNNQPHHGARTSNLDQHHTILKNLSLLHFLAALCWLVLLAALPPLALRTFESLLPNLSMAWLPAGWGDSNSNAGFSSLLGVFWYHLFAQSPFNGPILLLTLILLVPLLVLGLWWLTALATHQWHWLGRVGGRGLLAGTGFIAYSIFSAVMITLGLLVLGLYRLLVLMVPIIKVMVPTPKSSTNDGGEKQPLWKRIWRSIIPANMGRGRRAITVDGYHLHPANPSNPSNPAGSSGPAGHPSSSHLLNAATNKTGHGPHFVAQRAKFVTDGMLPPIHFLATPTNTHRTPRQRAEMEQEMRAMASRVKSTLAEFGAAGEIVAVKVGPIITLYEFEPKIGIKNAQVINLAGDMARSLSALAVRIAPMAGRSVLAIEVPHGSRERVHLGELVASPAFQQSTALLPLVLGKNILGQAMVADLSQMPHLLISGTTGSGKSVAMNGFLLSLLYRHSPASLRLILIDPKMLELSLYQDIPHLLTPVVTDPKKAVLALLWATREMERRYSILSEAGVRNLHDYHRKTRQQKDADPLPYIVIMVDEMADLMLVMGKEMEMVVQRLAQMARAAGIHLIMATQRPSVDVITGTIKANFPIRLSYALPTRVDSRTILGVEGAEQLLGQGDFLIMNGGRIERGHAPFTSEEEVSKVTDWWRGRGEPQYLPEDIITPPKGGSVDADGRMGDDLYERALQLVQREKKASTSFLQRHLQIGYNRAATLIELLEKNGVVGPANHVGKRDVLF